MKPNFIDQIEKDFPQSFSMINSKNMVKGELISPFVVELPKPILQQAREFIAHVYKIKELKEYQESISNHSDIDQWPQSSSVLTCFDFHYNEESGLKLIEINTNASLFIPFCLLEKIHNLNNFPNAMDELWDSFQVSYSQIFNRKPHRIGILDTNPESEGLYFEFLLYNEWLKKRGLDSQIYSIQEYNENPSVDFIYNRMTDFYLTDEHSRKLLNNYKDKKLALSPHPREYFLIADKKRLPLLRTYPELTDFIPQTKLFSEFKDQDEIWAQRKKYFFKPSQSFGSKAVYLGKSISKTNFQRVFSPNYIAQEFVPPGRFNYKYQEQNIDLKYDLRFFSFDGSIQNAGARLYRGQTTNANTPYGGLAPLRFI